MKKIIAMALAILMIMSMLPMSVFAADVAADLADAGYTVISDDKSTLAPGVEMNEVVMYDSKGDRVEMYITTSDPTVPTVQFYANYKDNQCEEWGMQTLSEQVAAIEANYEEPFKVVAGLNASYYNTTTGKPTGAFVMEGVDVTTESEGNNFAFFAVLKDGTVMIGDKGEYSSYKGKIKEAIGGYVHIVKDGAIVSGLDKTTKYPRQTIGITADGKVITMTADGSQAPQTVGLTYYEQAQVMLELGCVDALHLDGGNSATFGAIREGSDKFETVNSPSGQAERAVSNTLMIVSTAVADGTFDHAVINGDYEYYAPNSTYTFTAFGVDATNAFAEIPETAVWTLSDNSFGTISNGKFISNGKLGNVDIQLSDNGNVVGSKTITVVNPTSASFALEETTVPYGKTATIAITALYEKFDIYTDDSHYAYAVDPEAAGSMNGFEFTANNDETVQSAVVTATYKYAEGITDSIVVKFGKGSEVLFDFEDGDISDWKGTEEYKEWREEYNVNNPPYQLYDPDDYSNGIDKQSSSVFLATKDNGGKVKNGDYALGFRMNHTQLTDVAGWIYNYLYYTGETKVLRDVANGQTAIRLGMWVYSPDITNVAFRIVRGTNTDGKVGISYKYMVSDYDGKSVSYSTNYAIPEAGWIYIYYDLTDLADSVVQSTSISGATQNGIEANKDYYPAFLQLFTGSATDTMEDMIFYIDDITLDYSDVTEDRDAPTISETTVCYDTANFVALNGQKVNNNVLSFSAKVTDISDNSNMTGLNYDTAKIYIDGIDVSDKSGFKAANGYITLSDIYLTNGKHSVAFVIFDNQGNETRVTKTITVEGLASNSVISIAGRNDGNHIPKAGSIYYIDIKASDAAKIKEVTTVLKLNTANTFEYDNIICADGVKATATYDPLNFEVKVTLTHDGSLSGDAVLASIPVRVWAWDEEYTGISAADQFKTTAIPVINIECETRYGSITYADNTYDSYICGFYGSLNVATELDNVTVWHEHNATAMDNKAATCTENGYTGRTYCDGCASVVDWGTTDAATGHTYSVVDGKIVCADCKETYKANGLVQIGYNYYYIINGSTATGWQMIGSDWYYFDPATSIGANGNVELFDDVIYNFVNGKLSTGIWADTLFGTRYYYGPGFYKAGWYSIDGKDYCFDNGYRLEDGWQLVLESQQYRNWYYFDENGVCADKSYKPEDGLYTDRNGLAGAKDGIGLSGVCFVDGKCYYFDHHGYAQKNGIYGGRLFKDDYAAYTGLLEKDGTLYYYENGKSSGYGLYEIDDAYYYVYWGGVVKTDGRYWVDTTHCDLPANRNYTFGADGKMLNGVVEKDGVSYLYINGTFASNGLYKVNGEYYYSYWGGELKSDGKYYVDTTYCDLPAGTYTFGEDGKMLNGIENIDGVDYLYINGKTATYGLYEVDGEYYYSNWGGILRVDGRYWVDTTYCDLPANRNYTFGADGKMLDGVVDVDGTLYLYINGNTATCGLYKIDGEYYYSYWGGVLKTDGRYWVDTMLSRRYVICRLAIIPLV